MSFKIDFDTATYDRHTRIAYASLDKAIRALPADTSPIVMLALLENYNIHDNRLTDLELVDLKEEIIADLKGLGFDINLLQGDNFMKVDYHIDDILSDGFGDSITIDSLARQVIKWMLENVKL